VLDENSFEPEDNYFKTEDNNFITKENSFKTEDNHFKPEDNYFRTEDNSFETEDNCFKTEHKCYICAAIVSRSAESYRLAITNSTRDLQEQRKSCFIGNIRYLMDGGIENGCPMIGKRHSILVTRQSHAIASVLCISNGFESI
jgi:hypothetical protein